jgi:hypothetical protein
MGVRRLAAVIATLVATTAACTQGVTTNAPTGRETEAVRSAPVSVSSTLPPTGVLQTTTPPAPVAVSSTSAPVVTSATATTAPPTFARRFAAALAPIEVSVLGVPVSVPARDSVARLWLLVGRPPTADELSTAVTAAVRDGVPLDAIATLLLHSPDGAVAPPDASPERFVAALYEGLLGRHGKPAEVAAWVDGLEEGMSPGDVAVGFAESPEAVRRTGTMAPEPLPAISVQGVERSVSDSVLRLYLGLLVRLPTADELDRDVDNYTDGEPLAAIAGGLLQSADYRDRRPDGDAASVLAGLFEDVLGSHPPQAVVASWADQLGDAASAGQVAAAFTESAAVVARTGTTAPVAPVVPATPHGPVRTMPGTDFLAVGDSIMLGATSALQRQFPGIAIDAEVGRQFSEGVSIVRALSSLGTIPGTVIVHLGTNGTVSPGTCDEMMNLLAGKRVVIVNVHVPRPWEAPNNDVLAACAQRHGAVVVDWYTSATGLAPDGFHLSASGVAAYTQLIATSL